jgi:hypothetical protein
MGVGLTGDNYGFGPQVSDTLVVRVEFGNQETCEVEREEIGQSQNIALKGLFKGNGLTSNCSYPQAERYLGKDLIWTARPTGMGQALAPPAIGSLEIGDARFPTQIRYKLGRAYLSVSSKT